jgi:hypothetical protein
MERLVIEAVVATSHSQPAQVPPDREQAADTAGKSLRQIARDLNASQTQTAHGGRQWWPSTVRAVLGRALA